LRRPVVSISASQSARSGSAGKSAPAFAKHSAPRRLIRNAKRAVILDRTVQYLDGSLQIGADSHLAQDRFERG